MAMALLGLTIGLIASGGPAGADLVNNTPSPPGPYTGNAPVTFTSTTGNVTVAVNEVSPANPATTATHRETTINAIHIHRTILAAGVVPGGPNIPVLDDDIIIAHSHCDADLTAAPPPNPQLTKGYSPASVAAGGTSTATLRASNGNTAGGANPVITDTFP